MRPELFRFADIAFPSYFVLFLSGFIFATTLGVLWARRIGEDPDVIVDLGALDLLVGRRRGAAAARPRRRVFLGLRPPLHRPSKVDVRITLRDCLHDYGGVWDQARGVCHPQESDCFAWAKFWAGGLTYYGGFLGALVPSWYLLKRDWFSYWRAADMAGFACPWGSRSAAWGASSRGVASASAPGRRWGSSFPPHSPATEAQFKAGELTSLQLPVARRAPHADLRIGGVVGHRGVLSPLCASSQAIRRAGVPRLRRALRDRSISA